MSIFLYIPGLGFAVVLVGDDVVVVVDVVVDVLSEDLVVVVGVVVVVGLVEDVSSERHAKHLQCEDGQYEGL